MRYNACKRSLQRFLRANPGVERRLLWLYKNLCEADACLCESRQRKAGRKKKDR